MGGQWDRRGRRRRWYLERHRRASEQLIGELL